MQSKNKVPPTAAERRYIVLVRELPCSICDKEGPSEVHEIVQGAWYLSVALCGDCHRGPINGLHGQRRLWKVLKLDELGALAITIRRLHP